MDQQQKLMENMKSMEPLLKTAQSFLDKFESSSMGKMFEKIPGMSSMFGGGATAGGVFEEFRIETGRENLRIGRR
jgi:hypothetical protein